MCQFFSRLFIILCVFVFTWICVWHLKNIYDKDFYFSIITDFGFLLFSSGHCLSWYPQFVFEALESLGWIFVHFERRIYEGIGMRFLLLPCPDLSSFISDVVIRASLIFRITLALSISKMFYDIFIQKLTLQHIYKHN